jgi:acyl carrier protein
LVDIEPIRSFIRQKFLFDDNAPLADDQELYPGIFDSLGVLELVAFVEKTYSVNIEDDELLVTNFQSLAAIAVLLESKQG